MTVEIQKIWKNNVEEAMAQISGFIKDFPMVAIDTEFPGTIWPSPDKHVSYEYVQRNVNATRMIQLGLSLSDSAGHLPEYENKGLAWQFNFKFDPDFDRNEMESIQFLKNHGIDFKKTKTDGIEPDLFAHLLSRSGLIGEKSITWVVFQGALDLGYLVRNLIGGEILPEDQYQYFKMFRERFLFVYDIKHLMNTKRRPGGLATVASELKVARIGEKHEAASDSLLTMQVFLKLKQIDFAQGGLENHVNVLLGLGNIQQQLAEREKSAQKSAQKAEASS